jgi:hypothetical protein
MLPVRKSEIEEIIELMFDKDFCKNILDMSGFKEGVELDLTKVCLAGHSFGGTTVL